MRGISIAVAVCLLAGFASAFDILELRNVDASAVSDYPDLAQMKEEALLLYYYEGNGSGIGYFAELVYDYANEFVMQYDVYEAGGAPEFGRLGSLLESLESVDWKLPLSDSIVRHAGDSFSGFVNDAAGREAKAAEREASTRLRILHYAKAGEYYGVAGNYAEAASVSGKSGELEKAYNQDMMDAERSAMGGRGRYESALMARNVFFGVPAYADLLRANADFRNALSLYLKHGETEAAGEAGQEIADASQLAGELSGGVFVFSALFAVLALAVALKIARVAMGWWGDEYDEGLGNEMI